MSARPPEWLTVDQAAAELGLSPSGFRGLAEAEHLTIRRRGNQPGVARADVDAYLERARIHPGGITAGRRAREFVAGRKGSDFAAYEPYAKKPAVDVLGLVEATVLRDELGWTDADIGEVLGLHFSSVSRRRVSGFRSDHIKAMRQAINEARGRSWPSR
jgi:excisionase family DNA binding protein